MPEPTPEELLSELRRLNQERSHTPTAEVMNESGEYWVTHYQDQFGSWNNALQAAGLEPNQPHKIPTDDLLNELRRLARKLNKTPTKAQMDEMGEYYGRSYQLRFGSWSEAVRHAGFEPNQRIPASEFRERPDTCPLCGKSPDDELDFHHWRYGANKTGCYLCRDCHDRIHDRGARPDQNVDWLLQAIENLIHYHEQNHGDTNAAAIADRYNIPSKELVTCVLTDIEV